jgi:hypothetical protein
VSGIVDKIESYSLLFQTILSLSKWSVVNAHSYQPEIKKEQRIG